MSAQSHRQHNKAKVTFDCTLDERAYIKMLAAKAHLNLSEFILSYLRKDFPKTKANKTKPKPNKKTLDSIQELKEGRGIKCESIEDFWDKMGMNPHP